MEVIRHALKWIVSLMLLLECIVRVDSQLDVAPLANIIFVTRAGFFDTRVHCTEILHCTGEGEDVIWTLFGLGSTPIADTDTRFVNTTMMIVNNVTVTTAKLIISPVSVNDDSFYICQVGGNPPTSTNVRLNVDEDPIEIVTDIPTIDVSNRTVGDLVPIVCQVETCLADVIVSIYKGDQVVFTSQAMEPFVNSVSFLYQHEVTANSAGLYACRGFTTQGSTPFHYFNITGIPISPPMPTPVDPAPSSSSDVPVIQPSSAPTVTATPTSTMDMAGSSMGLMVQWTTLVSLIVVTLVTMILL